MLALTLTCALCALQPGGDAPVAPHHFGSGLRLELSATPAPGTQLASLTVLPSDLPADEGSGDGEEHSNQMTTMWIVMGVMMAVMMVGAGIYLMRGSGASGTHALSSARAPALAAVPEGARFAPGG